MTAVPFATILALFAAGGAIALGRLRWQSQMAKTVGRLEALSGAPASGVDRRQLDDLPEPVARYLRAALGAEWRPLRIARVGQRGEFLLQADRNIWRPFDAIELFTPRPIGFVWNAQVHLVPGVSVFVSDAFLDGTGSMQAAVLGLVRVVDVRGTPEIGAGALHRYLAEAPWFPPALLPGNGVQWAALDAQSARATLTVGSTSVALDFRFGADGLVESVYTPARFRDVEGEPVPTPWEGRHWRYEARAGWQIPTRGEVAWLLPEGRSSYWRGDLAGVEYE